MLKAIIFDFDGVICNSIEAKTNAFKKLYQSFGSKIQDKVVNYHLKNGGVSRYKKFKFFHENFLKKKINQEEIDKFSLIFSNIVVKEVIASTYVPGVLPFIEHMEKKAKLFISTGTPTDEIKKILKSKNIDHFFSGTYGSPSEKYEHIKIIMNKYNFKSSEIIFFGDSNSDLEAAKEHNIEFILVKNKYNKFIQEKYNGRSIKNFLKVIL